MRKLGDLMKDLGFNPNSSARAQEAFLKNLIRASAESQATPADQERLNAVSNSLRNDSEAIQLQQPIKISPRKSKSTNDAQFSFAIPDLIVLDSNEKLKSRTKRSA